MARGGAERIAERAVEETRSQGEGADPLEGKRHKLERGNARLERELHKAHLIIDVQGKVAGLLGLSLEDGTKFSSARASTPRSAFSLALAYVVSGFVGLVSSTMPS